MLAFIYLIYSIGILVILFFVINNVLPFFFGAPFVPISDDRAKTLVKLANIKKGELACDLGSGDGKLVILMAKKGAVAHGYEINPILVWKSRNRIRKQKIKNAFINWKSFWGQDLSKFDLLTVYGITYMMPNLEKKLKKELKPGARVLSVYFKFPTWKPKKIENEILLYSSSSTLRSK